MTGNLRKNSGRFPNNLPALFIPLTQQNDIGYQCGFIRCSFVVGSKQPGFEPVSMSLYPYCRMLGEKHGIAVKPYLSIVLK
jgi:hypothetical protein